MGQWERFGEREWGLLGDAPLAAAAVVALASEGGGQREAAAMVDGWREAAGALGASALIRELGPRMDPERREQQGGQGGAAPASYDALLDEALALCQQAVALLGSAAPEELDAYRRFVMRVCEQVAAASSEQGIFGLGGARVSRNERSALDLVARALGYGRPDLGAAGPPPERA